MIINSKTLKDMFLAGYGNLENNKDYVDKLNVFPVPDGDTGTNMSLTMKSAANMLEEIQNPVPSMKEIATAITKGSLMGARGNSGVILSQILRGFGAGIEETETIDSKSLAKALGEAKKTSYKAVIKPVEGTILTVIKAMANYAMEDFKNQKDIIKFFENIVVHGKKALANTPNQLKELKEAGVVDSGGQGLIFIFEGMLASLRGEKIDQIKREEIKEKTLFEEDIHIFDKEPENGYCTEFMLMSNKITADELKDKIAHLGDSMVVVGDAEVVKIHIHTNNPGNALEIAGSYGNLDRIKIENMRLQYQNRLEQNIASRGDKVNLGNPTEPSNPQIYVNKPKIEKPFAIIAVTSGDGIATIMKDFGVDVIIKGGQTMNPSTSDFINAVDSLEAEDIIIYPNNSNIIMAANQAKQNSNKNIEVIPTKSIPQCLQGLLAINPFESFESNVDAMKENYDKVKSGEVTYSIRDTSTNGKEIKKGDFIGIAEKDIVSVSTIIDEAVLGLLEKMTENKYGEIITIFYGEDVEEETAEKLSAKIEENYNDYEVELYNGGQSVYSYLISVE